MNQSPAGSPPLAAAPAPFTEPIPNLSDHERQTLLARIITSADLPLYANLQIYHIAELEEARKMAALIGAERGFLETPSVNEAFKGLFYLTLRTGHFLEALKLAEIIGEAALPLVKKDAWMMGVMSNIAKSGVGEAGNVFEEALSTAKKLQIQLEEKEMQHLMLNAVFVRRAGLPIPNMDIVELAKTKGWWGDFDRPKLLRAQLDLHDNMERSSDPMEGWEALALELGVSIDREAIVRSFEADVARKAKKGEHRGFCDDFESWLGRDDVPASQPLSQAVYEQRLLRMLPNFSPEGIKGILGLAGKKGIELSDEQAFLALLCANVVPNTKYGSPWSSGGPLDFMEHRGLQRTEGLNGKVVEEVAKHFAGALRLVSDGSFRRKLSDAIAIAKVGISETAQTEPDYRLMGGKIAAMALEQILSWRKIEGVNLHEFVNIFAIEWVFDSPQSNEGNEWGLSDPILTDIFLKSIQARIKADDAKSAQVLMDFILGLKSDRRDREAAGDDGDIVIGVVTNGDGDLIIDLMVKAEQIDREPIMAFLMELAESLKADEEKCVAKETIDLMASVERATGKDLGSEALYVAWESNTMKNLLDVDKLRAIVRSRAQRAARKVQS